MYLNFTYLSFCLDICDIYSSFFFYRSSAFSSKYLLSTPNRSLYLLFQRRLKLPSVVISSFLLPLTPHHPHNFKIVLCLFKFISSPLISEEYYPSPVPRLILPTVALVPFSFIPTCPHYHPMEQSNQILFPSQHFRSHSSLPSACSHSTMLPGMMRKAGECPSLEKPNNTSFSTLLTKQFLKH